MTFEEACKAKANIIAELVIKKHRDYGPKNITDFGEIGILVRVNDKLQRLRNLTSKGKLPKNESVRDSWTDIAGYAIIALMLDDNEFEFPLGEE